MIDLLMALACGLIACIVCACPATPAPKPCPLDLEAQYTTALVAACKDAGSIENCPAAAELKAQHEAAQEDAGCRVKP